MVGIVLISHSSGLAEGAAELAGQIAGGARVVAAGGTDDGRLGTSTDRITAAIAAADAGDGVLLLPDLGSSVLSALSLLDDLDPDPDGKRLRIADAPFVEGAVAAAVAASGGADLESVADAARHARHAAKFDEPQPESPAATDTAGASASHTASAHVVLPANLHARPAGRLSQEAAKYTSTITIEHAGKTIDPTGVLAVMSLGAKLGSTVTVHADGPDADEAIKALAAILAEAE